MLLLNRRFVLISSIAMLFVIQSQFMFESVKAVRRGASRDADLEEDDLDMMMDDDDEIVDDDVSMRRINTRNSRNANANTNSATQSSSHYSNNSHHDYDLEADSTRQYSGSNSVLVKIANIADSIPLADYFRLRQRIIKMATL